MNKAFTKEDDDAPEPVLARPLSSLPPGVKNYMTPEGARRLREELEHLRDDQRIAYVRHSLQTAEIVQPPEDPQIQVRFGATVTVRNARGEEARYRLVGVDEVDIDRGWVSWRSPLATALLKARVGQRVRFRSPMGEDVLEVLAIA